MQPGVARLGRPVREQRVACVKETTGMTPTGIRPNRIADQPFGDATLERTGLNVGPFQTTVAPDSVGTYVIVRPTVLTRDIA